MTILEHLEELRQRLFKILWTLLPLFIFYVTFSIRTIDFQGFPIPYPWPDFYGSISTQLVQRLMDDLLPEFVQRVQLHPGEAIIVQFKVAIFLAVLTGMPMIVYQLSKFIAPGLYSTEKETIAKITVPATFLFLLGVLFAYLWILPFAFEFLYGVGLRMGLTPLVGPGQFFDVVLLFFVGMGLAFQTPIVMWGLTALGVVEPAVWKKYWRVAVVAFFFFGAAITPDGSGITMMLVAIPMTVLYAVGYVVADRTWKGREIPRTGGERRRSSLAVWSVVVVLVLALVGGFIYYNRSLFTPPVEASDSVLAAGNITLRLPAFVLYSPNTFASDVHSGALLRTTNETAITFDWAAGASDGRMVGFAAEGDIGGPILIDEDASMMIIFPALWTSPDVQTVTVTATDGNSGIYSLELIVAYQLLLRREFSDSDRDGDLSPGETVISEYLVFNYSASPGPTAMTDLAGSGVQPPSDDQRTLLSKGIFSSIGPSWSLETSIGDLDTDNINNMTASYTMSVEDTGLEEYGVSLFLTRFSQWSQNEDLRIWVQGETPEQFVYHWYLDLRFGTIYPVLEPL